MKKILTLLITGLMATTLVYAGGEEKKVCETKVDPKTKKEKEVCKTIKVHKKVEGDKVPDSKKK
jgi:hypothetical protein